MNKTRAPQKVWIQKSGDGVIEMSEEMEIIVLADDSDVTKDVTLVEFTLMVNRRVILVAP